MWRLQLINDFCKQELEKHIKGIVFYGVFDPTSHFDKVESYAGRVNTKREMKRLPNNINCRVPGISSEEMILRLDALGFAVSHKSACASRETDGSYVIEALGASREDSLENIRITFGRSTTKSDIEKLVKAMKDIGEKYTTSR